MTNHALPNARPARILAGLVAIVVAATLAFVAPLSARAAGLDTLQPRADQAPSLPLTVAISKVTGGENGPYVVKLTNSSANTIKVSAKVLLAIASHAESKARNLPEHSLAAGQAWTIADLVADDRVVVSAAGFAPLEIVVK